MFYFVTHSIHFMYGVEHMEKDHSDGDRKPAAAITWTTPFDLL